MPHSRSSSAARSMSPPLSSSARLQSIMPAPVRARSSATCLALIAMARLLPLPRCALMDIMRRAPATAGGRAPSCPAPRREGLASPRPSSLHDLHALLAFQHRVRDLAGDQPHGADGVIVPRDDVVDLLRVAIGVDDGD